MDAYRAPRDLAKSRKRFEEVSFSIEPEGLEPEKHGSFGIRLSFCSKAR
jgi:hypothetical protein